MNRALVDVCHVFLVVLLLDHSEGFDPTAFSYCAEFPDFYLGFQAKLNHLPAFVRCEEIVTSRVAINARDCAVMHFTIIFDLSKMHWADLDQTPVRVPADHELGGRPDLRDWGMVQFVPNFEFFAVAQAVLSERPAVDREELEIGQ